MYDLAGITRIYLERFPSESSRMQRFCEFISAFSGDDLVRRKNFVGHLTGSAFIVDREMKSMLLIHHRFLQKWLQPGGHVDAGETPRQAAVREAMEEVGIPPAELELVCVDTNQVDLPIDIDSHFIPPNAKKNEDSHYHHDMRYLFRFVGKGDLRMNHDEAAGMKWVPLTELSTGGEFERVAAKILSLNT